MHEDELTPEQQVELEALTREFQTQLARTNVDLQRASPLMREIAPPVERQLSADEMEMSFTVDVSGIVETLRALPDGAGTAQFVEAYNARF